MRTALGRTAVRLLLKPVLGPPVPVGVQRAWLDLLSVGSPSAPGVQREAVELAGRPAERHVPTGAGPGSVLLLHGGGFLTGSPRTHRAFASRLAVAAGTPVTVLDYRRAPESPYPAAVQDAVAAFDALPGPVAVVGDSAGAALALLLARERRPVAIGLVSPLLDLTAGSAAAYRGDDPLLRTAWLRDGARAFVGDRTAELSALLTRPGDLPPLLVQVAEHERLRAEGEALAAAVPGAELQLLPGLWHDAHVVAHLVPDAARAVEALGTWLGARTAATG